MIDDMLRLSGALKAYSKEPTRENEERLFMNISYVGELLSVWKKDFLGD